MHRWIWMKLPVVVIFSRLRLSCSHENLFFLETIEKGGLVLVKLHFWDGLAAAKGQCDDGCFFLASDLFVCVKVKKLQKLFFHDWKSCHVFHEALLGWHQCTLTSEARSGQTNEQQPWIWRTAMWPEQCTEWILPSLNGGKSGWQKQTLQQLHHKWTWQMVQASFWPSLQRKGLPHCSNQGSFCWHFCTISARNQHCQIFS